MVWFRFYSTSIIFDTVEDFNGTTAIFKMVWFRFYSTSIIFDTVENGIQLLFQACSILEPVKISGLEIFISSWFRFYSTSIIFGTIKDLGRRFLLTEDLGPILTCS